MAKLLMVLAQAPGLPNGDLEDRLELELGLTPQGQLDMAAHAGAPAPWLAKRSRPGQATRVSELIQHEGGWALQSVRHDDDPLWRFEGWVYRPGELVRLGRPDGTQLLFRIVQVE